MFDSRPYYVQYTATDGAVKRDGPHGSARQAEIALFLLHREGATGLSLVRIDSRPGYCRPAC